MVSGARAGPRLLLRVLTGQRPEGAPWGSLITSLIRPVTYPPPGAPPPNAIARELELGEHSRSVASRQQSCSFPQQARLSGNLANFRLLPHSWGGITLVLFLSLGTGVIFSVLVFPSLLLSPSQGGVWGGAGTHFCDPLSISAFFAPCVSPTPAAAPKKPPHRGGFPRKTGFLCSGVLHRPLPRVHRGPGSFPVPG